MPFSPSIKRLSWLALAAGVLLTVVGLAQIWTPDLVPRIRDYEYLRWSLIALIVAWPLARALKLQLASTLALVWLVAHIVIVGLLPVLVVALLGLAALGVGTWLTARMPDQPGLSLVLGMVLIAAGIGWLLPLRIHFQWVYLAALGGLAYARRDAIGEVLGTAALQWRQAVAGSPRMAALTVAAVGITSVATWIPSMMSDDLAYHLALPTQLQQLGYYRLDPASQVWALAPWAADVVQAIAQVSADREARGSVNLLWLLISAWLLYGVCRAAGLKATWAWLGVALYASLPMTGALLVSMQTELPATAALLALAGVVMRSDDLERQRVLLWSAVLVGFLLQLKISFVLPVAWFGLWLLLRWRGQLPWRYLPRAVLAGMLVGAASYTYAWILAGNPLLPLFNDHFKSPYFVIEAFFDERFGSGWSFDVLWQSVLHTDAMNEGWAGAGGFHCLALAALLPLAVSSPRARGLTLVAVAYALSMFTLMHYLRYMHPAMVLLIPGLLVGLTSAASTRVAQWLGIALLLLNLIFHANANWALRDGTVRSLLANQGDPHAVLLKNVPERLLVASLDRRSRVLVIGQPFHAPFGGRAFVANWYDHELVQWSGYLASASDPNAMRALLDQYGFTHVLIARNPQIADLPARLAAIGAVKVRQENDASLWQLQLSGIGQPRRDLMRERDLARKVRHAWR